MRPLMQFSDSGLRITWILAVLSTAATIQQYLEGKSSNALGVAILAVICYVLLGSYYRWVKWLRDEDERRVNASKRK